MVNYHHYIDIFVILSNIHFVGVYLEKELVGYQFNFCAYDVCFYLRIGVVYEFFTIWLMDDYEVNLEWQMYVNLEHIVHH
jgi:hypothetical protein